jgi:DNA-binding transcriptional ArsR family regulator
MTAHEAGDPSQPLVFKRNSSKLGYLSSEEPPLSTNDQASERDVISLSQASIGELIDALEDEATLADAGSPVPPLAEQIARFATEEAVRLIRLGTRRELSDASVELAQVLAGPVAQRLKDDHPEAHRLLSGASVAIGAAAAPSSSGGEMTVLRSWNGNALRAVALINAAEDKSLPRATLRDLLQVEESYLSHLLADLEAAGLVTRIRDRRTVTVHIGPSGRSDHVQQLLGTYPVDGGDGLANEHERLTRELFVAALERADREDRPGAGIPGMEEIEHQVEEIERYLDDADSAIEETVVGERQVACRIRVSGRRSFGHREGDLVERHMVWVARIERAEIAEVEAWTTLEDVLEVDLAAPTQGERVGRELFPSVEGLWGGATSNYRISFGTWDQRLSSLTIGDAPVQHEYALPNVSDPYGEWEVDPRTEIRHVVLGWQELDKVTVDVNEPDPARLPLPSE